MKSIIVVFIGVMTMGAVLAGPVAGGEAAPQSVVDLAQSTLKAYGTSPEIVKAVTAANAEGKTLEQIKAMDDRWQNTPGIAGFMKAMMISECGAYLKKLQENKPYYAEIFVMDNQGANVAMTDKTSDYWQGDEAKFKKAFNNGQGAVFVDDVEFDDSAQAYISQVSVPVMDGGAAIGAITFGIDLDQLEQNP
ncbi:MAG: PDC sensor domain-containing protein [Thermodesulfobacteriota bacterium]|nr:PDC sensor domain-containing protein [Thermodesulfobacteriota bacterium]